MKTIVFFLLNSFCSFCLLSSVGASSPMVEKHMFSPEPDLKRSHKSPLALKLEKQVVFSGVIISSRGKWAMIREKRRKADSELRGLHKEGDEIYGMVIKEIGNNFLILAGEGKEVRLNLYHEGKQRPAMLAEVATSSASDDNVSAKGLPPASKSTVRKTVAKKSPFPLPQASGMPDLGSEKRGRVKPSANNSFPGAMPKEPAKRNAFPPTASPFPQASGMPALGSDKKGSLKPSASNSFLDAMPKEPAKGNASPPTASPFPKEDFPPNPFLEDQLPNPFLQETPPNPFLEQGPNAGGE